MFAFSRRPNITLQSWTGVKFKYDRLRWVKGWTLVDASDVADWFIKYLPSNYVSSVSSELDPGRSLKLDKVNLARLEPASSDCKSINKAEGGMFLHPTSWSSVKL